MTREVLCDGFPGRFYPLECAEVDEFIRKNSATVSLLDDSREMDILHQEFHHEAPWESARGCVDYACFAEDGRRTVSEWSIAADCERTAVSCSRKDRRCGTSVHRRSVSGIEVECDYPEPKKVKVRYVDLIRSAISSTETKRMTLAEIYDYIDNTALRSGKPDKSWKNSVRHSLSMSKMFRRIEREGEKRGKGGYWVLDGDFAQDTTTDKHIQLGIERSNHRRTIDTAWVEHPTEHTGLPATFTDLFEWCYHPSHKC